MIDTRVNHLSHLNFTVKTRRCACTDLPYTGLSCIGPGSVPSKQGILLDFSPGEGLLTNSQLVKMTN